MGGHCHRLGYGQVQLAIEKRHQIQSNSIKSTQDTRKRIAFLENNLFSEDLSVFVCAVKYLPRGNIGYSYQLFHLQFNRVCIN